MVIGALPVFQVQRAHDAAAGGELHADAEHRQHRQVRAGRRAVRAGMVLYLAYCYCLLRCG